MVRGYISKHYLYGTWHGMIRRCEKTNHISYKYYGGRGIKVCKKWRESFVAFAEDMGRRPKGHTLERKNKDGNYTSRNTRWASKKQQANNRRKRTSYPSKDKKGRWTK